MQASVFTRVRVHVEPHRSSVIYELHVQQAVISPN